MPVAARAVGGASDSRARPMRALPARSSLQRVCVIQRASGAPTEGGCGDAGVAPAAPGLNGTRTGDDPSGRAPPTVPPPTVPAPTAPPAAAPPPVALPPTVPAPAGPPAVTPAAKTQSRYEDALANAA